MIKRMTEGPAIHAANDMLQRRTPKNPTEKWTILGWSPWGHHFLISEFETKEEVFEHIGDVRRNGFTILPPGQKYYIVSSDNRIFPSNENREAHRILDNERKEYFK